MLGAVGAPANIQAANGGGFGEVFGDLLGDAADIGKSWFQWELQSDILKEQLEVKALANQLNNQQTTARAKDATTPTAAPLGGLSMTHIMLGLGGLLALVLILKLVGG